MPNITYKGQVKLNIVNGNRGNFDQINVDSNIDDIDNWPGSVNPETMEPPLIVTSKAKVNNLNVDMLNGKFSTDFVQINSSNNGVAIGGTSYLNATPPENGIIISGVVGIGTSSPSGLFHVDGGVASSGTGKSITLNAQDGASGSNGGNINLIPGTTADLTTASNGQIIFHGDIIPDKDATYDIGKSDKRIRDIYVSENSVWFGEEFQLSVNEQSGTRSIGFRQRKKDNSGNFIIPRNIRSKLGQNGAASNRIRHKGVDYNPATMPVHILNDFMREEVTLPSGVTDPWQDTTTYDSQGRKSGDTGFDSGDTSNYQVDLFTDVSGDVLKAAWTRSGSTINYTNGNVYIGNTTGTDKLEVKGNLRIINSSSDSRYVSFNVSNSASGTTYVLPDSDGSNNQFLKTNGSGTLSWGGLTVQELDDNPTINNVSTIKFDSSTGLEVTDLGSNAVKVSIGSHWKNLIVSGQTTLSPTGQEPLEFVAGSNITLTTDATTTPKKITINASGTLTASSLSVGDTSFSIIDPSSGYLVYQIDGVEKLRISNSGYIGFGTNNPQAPIDIRYAAGLHLGSTGGEFTITESSDNILIKNTVSNKDLIFNMNSSGTDTEILRLRGASQSLALGSNKKITFDGANSLSEYIYGDGSHLYFGSSNDLSFIAGNSQKMRLLSSGYLGIGTASPSSELDVNGTITATSVSASTFTGNVTGNLTGNVTGNVSGSSGSCTGNSTTATTATVATNVNILSNNTNNESTYITFVDGSSGTQRLETDTGLKYNPSSGLLTLNSIRLTGSSSGYLNLSVPSAAGSTTYVLPSSDGSSGHALVTNGSGTLSWSQVGSTLTVKEVDGSPSISNVSTIEFDQSTGLTVTDQGSNVARISLGSHWKDLVVSGQTTLSPTGEESLEIVAGSNMTITTDPSSNPQKITFASSGGDTSLFTQNSVNTSNIYYTTGNIGIGVTNPDQKLEVSGIIHLSGEQSSSPTAPSANDGGLLYVKDDGKLYYRSSTQNETDIATSKYMSSLTTKDITFDTTSATISTSSQNSPSGTTIVTSADHNLSADEHVLITGTGDSSLDNLIHQVSSVTNSNTIVINATASSNTSGGTISKNYGDYTNTSNKINITSLDQTLSAGEHYIMVSWTSKFNESPLDDQILELYYDTSDYSSDTITATLPSTKLSTLYRSNNAGDYHTVTETIFVQVPVTQTYHLRWARSSRGVYDWGSTAMKLTEENFKITYVQKADIVAYRSQYQSKSITLKNNSYTISSSTVSSEYTTINITADHSYTTADTLFITGTGDSKLDNLFHTITSLPDARNIRISTVGTSSSTGGTISQNYGNYTDTSDKYVLSTLDNGLASGDYQIFLSWTSNFIDNPLDDQVLELYYQTSSYSSNTLTSTLPNTSNRLVQMYRSNSTSDFHTMTRSIYLQVPADTTYYLRWARSSRGVYDWGSGSMNLNEESFNIDYFSSSVVTSAKTDKVYVNDTKVEVTDTSSSSSINMTVNNNQAGLLDNNVKFRLNSGSNTNSNREFSVTSGSSNYNLMTVWEGASTGNNGVGIELGDRNFTFSAASDSLVRIKASNSRGIFTDCVGMRTAGSNDNFVNFSSTDGTTLVGKIKLVNNTSVQYAETSDRRIKNNITSYSTDDCYEKIKNIKVRKFRYNNGGCTCNACNTNVGFIAQELAEVDLPGWNDKCNNSRKGWVDGKLSKEDKWVDKNGNVYKGYQKEVEDKAKIMDVDYGRITPYLIGAIQKQAELIENLQKEIRELKSNNT